MSIAKIMLVVGVLFAVAVNSFAQTYYELSDARKKGLIAITDVCGNGACSGGALSGRISNATNSSIRILVYLSQPLFFRNFGAGQSMAVTEVYFSDGGYDSIGTDSFIELEPRGKANVMFISYCTDFEKDNPAQTDAFRVAEVPSGLLGVLSQIAAYANKHPDSDITAAAQLAIWMTQGVTLDHISEKFEYAQQDVALAKSLMR